MEKSKFEISETLCCPGAAMRRSPSSGSTRSSPSQLQTEFNTPHEEAQPKQVIKPKPPQKPDVEAKPKPKPQKAQPPQSDQQVDRGRQHDISGIPLSPFAHFEPLSRGTKLMVLHCSPKKFACGAIILHFLYNNPLKSLNNMFLPQKISPAAQLKLRSH